MSSNAPQMLEIVHRLERLERQNRRLKRAGVVALAAIGAVLLMGQAAATPKVIEAQKFVLKDSSGRIRGDLSVLASGASALRLDDGSGHIIVGLFGNPTEPGLALYLPNGTQPVEMSAWAKGGMLQLTDPATSLNATLQAGTTPPFAGPDTLFGGLKGGSIGAQLVLTDEHGYSADVGNVDLSVPATGETRHTSAASIVMFGDKEHKVIWQAPEP